MLAVSQKVQQNNCIRNLHLIYNWQTWYPEYSSRKLFVVSQLKASNSIDLNSIVFQQIGCSDCQRLGKTAQLSHNWKLSHKSSEGPQLVWHNAASHKHNATSHK